MSPARKSRRRDGEERRVDQKAFGVTSWKGGREGLKGAFPGRENPKLAPFYSVYYYIRKWHIGYRWQVEGVCTKELGFFGLSSV